MKYKESILKDAPEITIFQGSPPEDVEHAKSFWMSLTLQPPLESRLVSAEIRQRLRVAPPPSRLQCRRERDFQREKKQEQLREKVNRMAYEEERVKYRRLAQNREAVLDLLYKQRAQRLEKEMIRNNVRKSY